MQVAQALQHRFGPELPVELANHPPAPTQALLAQVLLAVQVAALAVVAAGPAAEPWLARVGIQLPPETWRSIQDKKVALMMGIWFLGNTVRQNLLSTGAFEVSYAGTSIFSKLATGRMPTLADVVNGVGEAMAASGADGTTTQ